MTAVKTSRFQAVLASVESLPTDDQAILALYSDVVKEINPTPDQNQASIYSITEFDGTAHSVDGGVLWWNGITLAKQKVDFIKNNGFGGVACFDVGEDVFNDSQSLLQNIYSEMYKSN